MPNKQINKQPKSKSSTLSKSDTQDIKKKLTNKQVRERLLNLSLPGDPDRWSEADAERIIKKTIQQSDDKSDEEVINTIITLGLDNDYALVPTVSKHHYGLIVELRRKLIKDFACENHAEKALVDMAVSGYMRVIRASEAFTRTLEKGSTNNNLNQFMATMSKEIDRAHRHFTVSYQMLVQLKQPAISVHLKANNAFVAQAQQFNMEKSTSDKDEETINPK